MPLRSLGLNVVSQGYPGDVWIHRVGGPKAQGFSSGSAKGCEELLKHLVRTIGRPNLLSEEPVSQEVGK